MTNPDDIKPGDRHGRSRTFLAAHILIILYDNAENHGINVTNLPDLTRGYSRSGRAGIRASKNNEWYRLQTPHTWKNLAPRRHACNVCTFVTGVVYRNALPKRYLKGKCVDFFFYSKHACIFHATSCLNIDGAREREQRRRKTHNCAAARDLFCPRKRHFPSPIAQNRACYTDWIFKRFPFRRMDGWIIAFNEFVLASKSRVALCSPFRRERTPRSITDDSICKSFFF